MITKITADNDREYFAPRFEQITAALAAAAETDSSITPVTINSLESYYANIVNIAKLQTRKQIPGKFLLVAPADEPYFEIDANARVINIPAHFKKYGVGVQGDDEAELLVFKIDRYFDYTDFMETKISINWNFTPQGSRVPLYEDIQSQEAFAPDDTLEPGYVVFGFVIKKDMTPSKGVLNFSVTCYKENSGDIVYSFNTQTASVNVNEGLTLSDPSAVKNVSNKLLNRLTDSAFTPDSIAPIQPPVWQIGAVDENGKVLGLPEKLNFNLKADGTEDAELPIITQAYTPGLATMKYTWYNVPENGNVEVVREPNVVTSPADYFKSQDTAYDSNSVYYLKDDDGRIITTPITAEEYAAAVEDGKDIYELGSTYAATSAGRYQVKAQGELITVQEGSTLRTVSEMIESNVCLVPAAAKPAVALEVETAYEDDYEVIDNSEGYKYISSTVPPVINAVVSSTSDEALGAIAVEVLKDDMIEDLTAEDIIAATKTGDDDEDWKYDFKRFDSVENGKFQVNAAGVTQEGEYKVRAINRRNHTYSVSDPSDSIKTSFIAPKITKLNVYTYYNDTRISLLDQGNRPADVDPDSLTGKVLQINRNVPSITFIVDDATEASNKYADAITSYYVEELWLNEDGTGYIPSEENSPDPDEIEIVYDASYTDALHQEDNVGAYKFEISGDSGYYRIRTENRYHGTLRIGYSDVFSISII